MSAFGIETIGARVALDVTGSYPTGLLAALGVSYNIPQELTNAQLRYTAAQADINAQQDAAYSQTNLQLEKTANIAATNLATQLAATMYKDASYAVNQVNQNVSDTANTAYANAYAVYKIASDASYTAYLTYEATQIVQDKAAAERIVVSVGKSTPDVNPIDITTLSTVSTMVGNAAKDAHNATITAQTNAQQYLFKTQEILGAAIYKSTSVTVNLTTVAAFNTLVKAVIQNIADPLNAIAGKETLITQYVPSIPLNNAIQAANLAIAVVQGCITAISNNVTTNAAITTNVTAAGNLATSLDTAARGKDSIWDLADATQWRLIRTASTMVTNNSIISIPSDKPFDPYYVNMSSISTARAAKNVALKADISADNARGVYNALVYLQTKFGSNLNMESSIAPCAASSLKMLNDAMACVNRVTSNSSAYSAVAITRRASNTINGLLSQISAQEANSVVAASDAQVVLDLLSKALSAAVVTDLTLTQQILWMVNDATEKARLISEKAKAASIVSSRTAHNLVTPQTIAIQTAAANNAGALNNNRASRLDRLSRNVPVDPPPAYRPYQAGIRAQTFHPIRPTLDELVYKNRLAPLRVDSLRTILATKIKVAKDVQHLNDISAFSFRQQ
jgi:hypothetical protein